MALCQLCRQLPAITNSHVIPAFVYRALKSDSPTGFFRNPNNPNLRFQDGDKFELLCAECEGRFGVAERLYKNEIFDQFHTADQSDFSYGPWLHYFMTSLAWRTLVLDIPGFVSDPTTPKASMSSLLETEETMRNYLLGATHVANCLRNHAVAWTVGHVASGELARVGPNVSIRRSIFGYTVLDRRYGYSAVLHNLAGFMCFLILNGNPRDKWNGTKISPTGGHVKQPQKVSSWLIGELLGCVIEAGRNQSQISKKQQNIVADSIAKNPTAPALRFRELDRRIRTND